jgi:hypothetical protein
MQAPYANHEARALQSEQMKKPPEGGFQYKLFKHYQ